MAEKQGDEPARNILPLHNTMQEELQEELQRTRILFSVAVSRRPVKGSSDVIPLREKFNAMWACMPPLLRDISLLLKEYAGQSEERQEIVAPAMARVQDLGTMYEDAGKGTLVWQRPRQQAHRMKMADGDELSCDPKKDSPARVAIMGAIIAFFTARQECRKLSKDRDHHQAEDLHMVSLLDKVRGDLVEMLYSKEELFRRRMESPSDPDPRALPPVIGFEKK